MTTNNSVKNLVVYGYLLIKEKMELMWMVIAENILQIKNLKMRQDEV